jgi:hypothetical protein
MSAPARHDRTVEPTTVSGVIRWIARHPWQALIVRWNYKSAVLSAVMRALLFFAVNDRAGRDAALAAMTTEFCFRFATSGFYGAMTQNFRRVEPAAAGAVTAMIVLPVVAHSLEFIVHWWRGTAVLAASIAASVMLTVVSTAFNLFAMRRGALVVGEGQRPLLADLAAAPRLLVLFVAAVLRSCRRAWA